MVESLINYQTCVKFCVYRLKPSSPSTIIFWVCEEHQYQPKPNIMLWVPSVSILTITLLLEVHITDASISYKGSLT